MLSIHFIIYELNPFLRASFPSSLRNDTVATRIKNEIISITDIISKSATVMPGGFICSRVMSNVISYIKDGVEE